jgi:hypothetical protein
VTAVRLAPPFKLIRSVPILLVSIWPRARREAGRYGSLRTISSGSSPFCFRCPPAKFVCCFAKHTPQRAHKPDSSLRVVELAPAPIAGADYKKKILFGLRPRSATKRKNRPPTVGLTPTPQKNVVLRRETKHPEAGKGNHPPARRTGQRRVRPPPRLRSADGDRHR